MLRRTMLSLLSLWMLAGSVSAAEMLPYAEGLALARETGSPVYLLFGRESCPWCVRQDQVLQHPDVGAALDGYVAVYVDTRAEPQLAARYGVRAVPVSVVLKSSGVRVKQRTGYMDRDALVRWLR